MARLLKLLAVEALAVIGAAVFCLAFPDTFPDLTAWFAIHSGGLVGYSCSVGGARTSLTDSLCSPIMHQVASPRDLVLLMFLVALGWAATYRTPAAAR